MDVALDHKKALRRKQNQVQYAKLIADEFDCLECGKKTNKQNYRGHIISMSHKYAVLQREHRVLQREHRELQEKFNRTQ